MRTLHQRYQNQITYLATFFVLVAFVNFFWAMVDSLPFGGAVPNWVVREGRYYAAHRGEYTELSKEQWEWRQFHLATVPVTHLLGMASIGYLLFGQVFPAITRGATPQGEGNGALRKAIEASGPQLAASSRGGAIGALSFTVGLLHTEVYPGGVVLRPTLSSPIAVPAQSIRGVVEKRVLQRVIEVSYSPPEGGMFRWYEGIDSRVGQALLEISQNSPQV